MKLFKLILYNYYKLNKNKSQMEKQNKFQKFEEVSTTIFELVYLKCPKRKKVDYAFDNAKETLYGYLNGIHFNFREGTKYQDAIHNQYLEFCWKIAEEVEKKHPKINWD